VTGGFVGPYRVLDSLGAGGMGEVFLAEDTRLGRKVALKRPSQAWLSIPEARARLHREASAAAALTHPHIAAIYDVLDVGSAPYIVMEYVEGESLAKTVARGPLPVERVVQIGVQITDALTVAHGKGIVHRDLKPGNVCMTAEGQAKILDFGLATARAPASEGADAARLTVPGQFIGSPGYASPEQLAGAPATPGDDIYALGVLLFELLTGRRPFQAENASDLAVATMTRTPPGVHELSPDVPLELSALIARALARDARDRLRSAEAFHAELRRVAEAVSSGPTGEYPVIQRPRRLTHVRAAFAVAALVAVTLVGAGLWIGRSPEPPTPPVPVIAVLPFEVHGSSEEDHALASGLRDVLIASLGRQPGINVLSRTATAEPRADRQDLDRWARDLGATLLVDASLQRAGGDILVAVELRRGSYLEWGQTYSAPAGDVFALQDRMASGLAGSTPLRTAVGTAGTTSAATQDPQALGLYGQAGDFLERPDIPGNVQRAVQLLQAALARDRRFSLASARLGEAYWALYEITREPEWTDRATAAIADALRLDHDLPLVRLSLARIYFGTGRTDDALEELDKVLEALPNNDDAHRLRGQVLQRAGRHEEAEAEYRRTIDLRPNYWRNHNVLGAFYYAAGQYAEALDAFKRVTEVQPDSARGFHNVGIVYYHMGDHETALEWYMQAIAVSPMPESHSAVGTIYYHQARYEAAAEAFRRAIELSPNDGLQHGNLGDALARLNRRADAEEAYREAVRVYHLQLGVNPNDATILARVAVNEAKLARKTDAAQHVARALELRANDVEVLYRAAVVHALNGESEQALAALERALQHGYSAAIARNDHDLASIRGTARFRELLAAY
jgi:eukaryotic-like serine/threonine-protein kinase